MGTVTPKWTIQQHKKTKHQQASCAWPSCSDIFSKTESVAIYKQNEETHFLIYNSTIDYECRMCGKISDNIEHIIIVCLTSRQKNAQID